MQNLTRLHDKPQQPIRTRIRRRLVHALAALAALPGMAWAELPDVSGGGDGGSSELMTTLQDYAASAGVLVGLVLATAAFLVVGGGAVGQFNEARQRGEWGGFATTVIIGVIMIVVVIWLANKAADIL